MMVGDLAAQLQRDGREIFARCTHDRFADSSGAGEQEVIERQRGKCRGDLASPVTTATYSSGRLQQLFVGADLRFRGASSEA